MVILLVTIIAAVGWIDGKDFSFGTAVCMKLPIKYFQV